MVAGYPYWHDIVAGAAAGLGARLITAPFDLIKIRLQLQSSTDHSKHSIAHTNNHNFSSRLAPMKGEWNIFRHFYSIAEREGGIRSLFRGNVAASYLWIGYSVVQFWVYGYSSNYLYRYYNSCNADTTIPIGDVRVTFTAGAMAGICGTLVTYPFDLGRTIFASRGIMPIAASNVIWSQSAATRSFQIQDHHVPRRAPKKLHEFFHQLYEKRGIQGFFAGCSPALVSIVPCMGLNFALHDFFVSVIESQSSVWDRSVASGVAGMGAGAISKFFVYPLDTVKKHLQVQSFWGSIHAYDNETTGRSKFSQQKNSDFSSRENSVTVGNNKLRQKPQQPVIYKGIIDCFIQIARREGPVAFYKGIFPSLLKSSLGTGASFWLFTLSSNILQSLHDSTHN